MKNMKRAFVLTIALGLPAGADFADCRNVELRALVSSSPTLKVTKFEYFGKGKWRTARNKAYWANSNFIMTVPRLKTRQGDNVRFRVTARQLVGSKITAGVQHQVFSRKFTRDSNASFCTNGLRYEVDLR